MIAHTRMTDGFDLFGITTPGLDTYLSSLQCQESLVQASRNVKLLQSLSKTGQSLISQQLQPEVCRGVLGCLIKTEPI